jgi:hypothetical protein
MGQKHSRPVAGHRRLAPWGLPNFSSRSPINMGRAQKTYRTIELNAVVNKHKHLEWDHVRCTLQICGSYTGNNAVAEPKRIHGGLLVSWRSKVHAFLFFANAFFPDFWSLLWILIASLWTYKLSFPFSGPLCSGLAKAGGHIPTMIFADSHVDAGMIWYDLALLVCGCRP